MKEITKRIKVKEYITDSKEALKELTTFNKPKYIIKSHTGMGGTTALLNVSHQLIIVVPLVGVISKKESTFKGDDVYFLRSSKSKNLDNKSIITQVINSKNKKVMLTAEMLYTYIKELKKNKSEDSKLLLNKLYDTPLAFDESHMAISSDYREIMGKVLDIIYNNFSRFILTTATPHLSFVEIPNRICSDNYINRYERNLETFDYDFVEIVRPALEIISIEKKGQKKITMLDYTTAQHERLIIESLSSNKKTIIFTNDIKEILKLSELSDSMQILCGDLIEQKLAKEHKMDDYLNKLNKDGITDHKNQLFIYTTKYATGYDIELEDANIFVYANANKDEDRISYLDIVQTFGRIRKPYNKAYLVYNEPSEKFEFPDACVDNDCYEYTVKNFENIKIINNKLTYQSKEILKEYLKDYNYKVEEDDTFSQYEMLSMYTTNAPTTILKILDFFKENEELTMEYYQRARDTFKGDNDKYSGISYKVALYYSIAYILHKYSNLKHLNDMLLEIKICDSKTFKLHRFLEKMVAFLQKNVSFLEKNINPIYLPRQSYLDKVPLVKLEDDVKIPTYIIMFSYAIERISKKENNVLYLNKNLKDYMDGYNSIYAYINELMSTYDIKNIYEMKHIFFKKSEKKLQYRLNKITNLEVRNKAEKKIKELLKCKETQFKYNLNDFNLSERRIKSDLSTYLLYKMSILVSENMPGFTANIITEDDIEQKSFKLSYHDNREYSPSTKIPRILRYFYVPFQYIEYDAKSFFPTVVDHLLDTNVKDTVYERIQRYKSPIPEHNGGKLEYTFSRAKAKELYNTVLNTRDERLANKSKPTRLKIIAEIKQLYKILYGDKNVEKLFNITYYAPYFFKIGTRLEREAMLMFMYENKLRKVDRVHDSIAIPAHMVENKNIIKNLTTPKGMNVIFGESKYF